MIGQSISHYEVLEELGQGGMGVLYRARDTRLDRTVAIKVLRPELAASADRRERFIREAKAASALNHPHIVAIYDIGRAASNGVERDFIVMEHVDGASLDRILARGPLAVDDALEYAVQIAEALAAAHEAGIVHRDIKPANVMVTKGGQVKLVDFGLAKLTELMSLDSETATRADGPHTEAGTVLGTAAYMSPEQAEGRPVDRRTDVFSFGAMLYEMLTGRRAFEADSQITTRLAILSRTPAAMSSIRAGVPPELERVVTRSLEKARDERYPSAVELRDDLRQVRERRRRRGQDTWRRPRAAVPAIAGVLILVAAGAWWWVRSSRERWARHVALPEITRLAEQEKWIAAYELAERARRYLRDDLELERLWKSVAATTPIRTDPPGADVSWKNYAEPESAWHALGRTPLESPSRPRGYFRWRFEKAGFETVERAGLSSQISELSATLHAAGTAPPGMVWVPRAEVTVGGKPVALDGFWLDRFEVSNRQFKSFVDAGGYRTRELWKEPFARDGREVSWEDAVGDLVDKTGRPGPATWELGSYPAGQDDHPVQGVSWYEAAAYAEFAGKSLPTVHHWLRATDAFTSPEVLVVSNFDGKGPARVGERQALGLFGTHDMAGNVKEWCWNGAGRNRYTAGGAWNEVSYLSRNPHAQSPFDRAETDGVRCAKYARPPAPALLGPLESGMWRDYTREVPVDDTTFRIYAGLYAYDRASLEPTTEAVDSGSPLWKVEKVTFNAAYGGERMIGYLFLPSNATPPFQTILYFPGSGAMRATHFEAFDRQYLEFVVRSGRAVFFPIYKGTYERRLRAIPEDGSRAERDLFIQWNQDVARSIDYLETRPDVAAGEFAYVGFSLGAQTGIGFLALEKRLKAGVLVAGGLDNYVLMPEVDPLNFITRITTPTLMVNGREDFRFPLEESQKPMFRLLGTPAEHKRHVVVPGGHAPPRIEVIKATLGWFDLYLGPVETKG